MNRVLINLRVPAISDSFDIFVPSDVPISKLNKIIANGVSELTSGVYVVSEQEQLCIKEPLGLLNPQLTLQDYGITDGMQLFLI